MGRIKTKLAKRVGKKIYQDHKANLKSTFDENKPYVKTLADFPSKKLRNIITGYVTRLAKKGEQ